MKVLSLEEIKKHYEAWDNMAYLSKRHPSETYTLDEIFSKEHIERLLHTAREYHRLREALEKIADPRKRDHKEPDDYTEKCCLMHIANEALKEGGE